LFFKPPKISLKAFGLLEIFGAVNSYGIRRDPSEKIESRRDSKNPFFFSYRLIGHALKKKRNFSTYFYLGLSKVA
jgi:hypothetical protein